MAPTTDPATITARAAPDIPLRRDHAVQGVPHSCYGPPVERTLREGESFVASRTATLDWIQIA